LLVNYDFPWWAGVLTMLAVGTAIGTLQGVWIAVMRVPSFVVTLAGLLIWLGVQLHVLGNAGTLNVFDPHITAIASTFLPAAWGWAFAAIAVAGYVGTHLVEDTQRRRARMPAQSLSLLILRSLILAILLFGAVAVLNRAYGVPTAGVLLFVLFAGFDWMARRTRFGRHIYAVGGHVEAARRAGINVARIRICVFALSGLLAAVGGLILTSRLQAASTQSGGGTLLLEAIAAAVIGGTSLFGGRGRVIGALMGSLVIATVANGIDLLGYSSAIKFMVTGAILLAAVTLDTVSRRRLQQAGR
jgi:D-xylose transport system permease protein